MTEFDYKLHHFKQESERINEHLNNFLHFSEFLLTEMLDKIPEHDYSIDASKELFQQFQDIKDKIHRIDKKMLYIRHGVWKVFYERQQKLLSEYHELYYKSQSLPENSEESINLNKLAKDKDNEYAIYKKL